MTLDFGSIASSGILTAMENNSVLRRTPAALRDKVIHADIRIDSIEDVPRDDSPSSQTSAAVENDAQTAGDSNEERERAATTQAWWDTAIQKFMGLNDGYENVAVLLVRWHDELDDLRTRPETEELQTLFTTQFNYQCSIVELDVLTKPQLQINEHLSSFLRKHDGANNLLIVYYTGHGIYRENKYLELTAREKLASATQQNKNGLAVEARLNWDRAESLLHSEDVEADVLTILDTCYASNGQKSGKEDARTHELLSACVYDATTASPGANSFTRALIDGLKELLQEYTARSFTTFNLLQKINKNPVRREAQSQLWDQIRHHGQHIRLAPLKPKLDAADAEEKGRALANLPRSYVTLRLGLRKELGQTGVEYLANRLAKAFSNPGLIGLLKIDWLGMREARGHHFGRAALAVMYFRKWRRIVQTSEGKRNRRVLQPVSIPAPSAVVEYVLESPKRKRRHDGGDADEVLRLAKRSSTLHENPPSPPVSESSRADDMQDVQVAL